MDEGGRIAVPGSDPLGLPPEWTPDHLLLAALLRCSLESLAYHARRGGSAARAAGSAAGKVTRREHDGRFAFVELDVAIDVILAPPPADPDGLFERAERDCFVGASLSLKPRYEWRLREPGG